MPPSPARLETTITELGPPLVAQDSSTPASTAVRSTRIHPSRSGARSSTHAASPSPLPSRAGSGSAASSASRSDSAKPPPTAAPNPIPFGANGTGTLASSDLKPPPSKSKSAPQPTISAKIGPGLLNATLPEHGFFQCQSAVVNITAEANQSVAVTVIDYHNVLQRLDVTIPPPVKQWNWTAVDFPAGTQLRIELAVGGGDVSSPQWASLVEMAHVHLGHNETSCLDAGDIASSAASAKATHHNSHLGTILGVTIPLVLVVGLVGAMVGLMVLRRKRERKDRVAMASDPASQLRDWQDRASMMWENSSRGLMRHTARPDLGRRAASLDSSTHLASGAALHVSDAQSPFDDPNQEDLLPTYKQSQRESRRVALPTYTRASTFTRATPSSLARTTTHSSIHLEPLPLSPPTELDDPEPEHAHELRDAHRHVRLASLHSEDEMEVTSSDTNSHRATDTGMGITRVSSRGSSGLCSLSFGHDMSEEPLRPHP